MTTEEREKRIRVLLKRQVEETDHDELKEIRAELLRLARGARKPAERAERF